MSADISLAQSSVHLIFALALRTIRSRWYGVFKRLLRLMRRWIFDPAMIFRQLCVILGMQLSYRLYLSFSKKFFAIRQRLTNPAVYETFQKLEKAKTFAEYKHFAAKMDELDPVMQKWRRECSTLYNINTINSRIERFERKPRDANETYELMFELRTGILRKHFGIGCSKLFRGHTSSTKKVIERYIRSILTALNVCARSPDISCVDKLAFLHDTRRSFGRTGLLLSGGLSNGAFHFGVIKGLFEADCLPNIISGSSAGSIIAAWLAVQTDTELKLWCENPFEDEVFNLLKYHNKCQGETELETRTRLMYEGEGVFDMTTIKEVVVRYCGDKTMLEAYVLTGRVTNIVVSSEFGIPFVINYLTAPHVYLWSAVCASVAVPGAFKPVELKAKTREGQEIPYERTGKRWRDGSFTSDLPNNRLRELFGVNHFIVSQVSPHRTFFGPLPEDSGFFGKSYGFLCNLTKAALISVEALLPSRFTWLALLRQEGEGDITIYPTDSLRISALSIFKLLVNPNVREYLTESERQVWRQSTRIRLSCAVEILMDHLIEQIEQGTLDNEKTAVEKKIYSFAGVPSNSDIGSLAPPGTGDRLSQYTNTDFGRMPSRREISSGRLFSVSSSPNLRLQHYLDFERPKETQSRLTEQDHEEKSNVLSTKNAQSRSNAAAQIDFDY